MIKDLILVLTIDYVSKKIFLGKTLKQIFEQNRAKFERIWATVVKAVIWQSKQSF